MPWVAPPPAAAWRHHEARSGFEVACFRHRDGGIRIEGCTAAVEDGQPWAVDYAIDVDTTWTTRRARVCGRSASGQRSVELQADGAGHWLVDGEVAAHLDGCLDVDLESSVVTNALPVHRLGLPVGGRAAAPAVYVRALDLGVERLEQAYARTAGEGWHQCYHYTAPSLRFACRLVYDESGLVLDYPGIAVRVT